MKYIEFKNKLKNLIVFSTNDIRKIDSSINFLRRIYEWQSKGYIKKVTKGFYIFSDFELNERSLFFIANKIYQPSYVSFEMALSHYNLIPEQIFAITSATSKKTQHLKTQFCSFYYNRIKPSLMFGYKLEEFRGFTFKIAEVEKALLDYFYIKSHLKSLGDFEELRIDKSEFDEIVNKKKLTNYLARFNSKALTKRVRTFLRFMKNA